jgi:hypothetical protein
MRFMAKLFEANIAEAFGGAIDPLYGEMAA